MTALLDITKGKPDMRYRLSSFLGLLALCALLAACGGGTSVPAAATVAAPTRAAASAPAATAPAAAAPVATTAATPAAATTAPAGTTAPVAATTAPATSIPAAPTAPAASAPSAAGGNAVAVELKDYAITLSTSTVSAGMVTFTIKNSGPSSHNFNVMINGEEKGVPTLDAGKTMTLTLDLKAGSYDFRCNVPGHSLLGMKGTLTVK